MSQKVEIKSPNFSFLVKYDAILLRLAAESERYCFSEPQISLFKQRQLCEKVAVTVAALVGEYHDESEELLQLLKRLESMGILQREIAELFHAVRKYGNKAVHENIGTRSDALHGLKLCRAFCIWFHQTFGTERDFKPGPFIPPPDPAKVDDVLKTELFDLRSRVESMQRELLDAKTRMEDETKLRYDAEKKAADAYTDLEVALDLAVQTEDKLKEQNTLFLTQLTVLQQKSKADPESVKALVKKAERANGTLLLDESDTRHLVDQQLRDNGWEADSDILRYAKGTRPEKACNRAIAEWPTKSGPVDYALFIGLELVAFVEAKKSEIDVPGVLQQAARYSRDYVKKGDETVPAESPWNKNKVPFIFATNGRAYLRQIHTKSGIWFQDLRCATNLPRPLENWYTPQGLTSLLRYDAQKAQKKLQEETVDFFWLRNYQKDAIRTIENKLAEGQREMLVAMATGTGKTRVCLGLMYRALRSSCFRRILFLVDRESLGSQAAEVFQNVKVESLSSLYDIYDVKELGDRIPEQDTRVQIATIQGMVRRLLYSSNDKDNLPIDSYDCIIVDECHRGYTLDYELSEDELLFRGEQDYISKYRRVLDHFDAVKIGFTATPALHTTQIFGHPVFNYSYRKAVIDGYLVDHEPPVRIITNLAENGIHWDKGDVVKMIDPLTGDVDLSATPDEINFDVDTFNSRVITENFNKTVCRELARHIDPALAGKTLIFCVNDSHADLVVYLLQNAFEEQYGALDAETVLKITGYVDDQKKLIRRYKNEALPKVAVTVDLLSTGIDVEEIVNIVFIRRVKSRILFEQMLGRGTRLCEDLFGKGLDKEVFRIFDAVDVYNALQPVTAMKPVVASPSVKLLTMVDELNRLADPKLRAKVTDDITVRIRKKKKLLLRHEQIIIEHFGVSCADIEKIIDSGNPDAIEQLFISKPKLAAFIDNLAPGTRTRVPISEHEDSLKSVEHGYGVAKKPEDYIDAFTQWVQANVNEIAALNVVTQRPRDLTRQDLREIKEKLDAAGFTEANLRTAWREMRNEDIAASIIGYIRTQSLGSVLIPYAERVDNALKRVLKKHQWTNPQRTWLQRIANQIKIEIIVDRETLDNGQFRADGGFNRLNKTFDGELSTLLQDFQQEIWNEIA